MQRRDFLRMGALGAALASTDALASDPGSAKAEPLSPSEMRRYVERLRKGMKHIEGVDLGVMSAIPSEKRTADVKERVELDGQLVRSSMRAMLLTSSIADLPEANRGDEELLAMVDAHTPEADFALAGMLDRVDSFTDAEYKDLQDAIRKDPDLPMRAAELLDSEAATAGIGHKRRLHLREIASHFAWKMQRQPLTLVMSEAKERSLKVVQGLLDQPEKLRGSKAPAHEITKWELQSQRVRRRFPKANQQAEPAPAPAPPPPPPLPVRTRGDGRRALRDGAICIGAGIGVGALSVLLIAAGGESGVAVAVGLFGITAAVGLLISGLILLIIGAIRAGSR